MRTTAPRVRVRIAGLALVLLVVAAQGVDGAPPRRPRPPGSPARDGGAQLLEQARLANPVRFKYAMDQGCKVGTTRDGGAFWLLWTPPAGTGHAAPPIIATLHGHGSFATDEFLLWHKHAAARGLGILALQWWKGQGERFQDYLAPHEIYRAFDDVLRELGVPSGGALLHGFSRGSANSYAVVAHDVATGNRYFRLAIANAGRASPDFPGNVAIDSGRFGARPLGGTHWVLFCGALDKDTQRAGCEGMAVTADWLRSHGAAIALFLKDPKGDHGGFHRNPANVSAALDQFSRISPTLSSPPARR